MTESVAFESKEIKMSLVARVCVASWNFGGCFGALVVSEMSTEIRYVKRVEMALDLGQLSLQDPGLPDGFFWQVWSPVFSSTHAKIMNSSFGNDLDGRIFPTYRQYEACEYLIRSSCSAKSFSPEGTWLIGKKIDFYPSAKFNVGRPVEFCAAIQSVHFSAYQGNIQNVSTLPQYRRLGLGRALVLKALYGFKMQGRKKAILEVTAENHDAIRLYSSVGFRPNKLLYSEAFVELY